MYKGHPLHTRRWLKAVLTLRGVSELRTQKYYVGRIRRKAAQDEMKPPMGKTIICRPRTRGKDGQGVFPRGSRPGEGHLKTRDEHRQRLTGGCCWVWRGGASRGGGGLLSHHRHRRWVITWKNRKSRAEGQSILLWNGVRGFLTRLGTTNLSPRKYEDEI